ncbi:hypothetical protein SAMN05444505_11610 [Pseudomonas syringae]|uniref:Uncharacterized protein n=1 Tax=Pseudomonas syringae TaxID=317 RepID=A0AB37ZUK1_PSESX|nr:hypothetical protein SAMN05444505_11610 [Pseudomonas syringae]
MRNRAGSAFASSTDAYLHVCVPYEKLNFLIEGIHAHTALCRLMKTLDDAGYVYRRIERNRLEEKDDNGLHLVRTRVLIRFTKLFWKDLGLAYVDERVQKSAKKGL